jgi:hypothetical protein
MEGLFRGRAGIVILFFRTILLFGIANLQNTKLLAQIVRPPQADAEKSRLGYAVGSSLLIGEKMPTSPGKPAHGAVLSFPKRNLSPLRRACLSLGLSVKARPQTNLAWMLRKAGLGKTGIEYLKFSKGEQAQPIIDLYYSLNATERKAVTIDYLIMAAGTDVHHVSGLIQEGVSRATETEASLLVYMKAPDVTRKAIERALTPEGHKDRELLLRIAEVVPAPAQNRFTVGSHRRGI